jgi:hypothetical protein
VRIDPKTSYLVRLAILGWKVACGLDSLGPRVSFLRTLPLPSLASFPSFGCVGSRLLPHVVALVAISDRNQILEPGELAADFTALSDSRTRVRNQVGLRAGS